MVPSRRLATDRFRFAGRLCGAALLALATFLTAEAPVRAHGPAKPSSVEAAAPPVDSPAKASLWRCPMCESVREKHPGSCPKCGMDLVRVDFGEAEASVRLRVAGAPPHDDASGAAPAHRALMPGLPDGLFFTMALAILGLSFALFAWGGDAASKSRGARWDLLRLPGLKPFLRHPGFLVAVRLPVVLLFLLVVAAGLFGNQSPERNLAPVLTWTIWWAWLIFVILFLGKIWCTVCPWIAIADWVGALPGLRRLRAAADGRRWPGALRNIWLATGMFVLLTWLELGYGVTQKPWLTAALGVLMVVLAVAATLAFERKAFCRYACLVGRVSGLYSMFASSELRAADPDRCRSCAGKDCYRGNERGAPCPTHQFLGNMKANTYCTLCMECVKSCPKDNVVWNVRPPGADLLESARRRTDEAYLAVILLSMSAFHGLTMTPGWDRLVDALERYFGISTLAAFSLGMAAVLAAPLLLYYGLCDAMRRMARDRAHATHELFVRFSYSLLPIALFYHLAHNLQHIFYEGMKLVRASSDPFGWGWDLFGTADLAVNQMLSAEVGWTCQVLLILAGHVYGIWIAHRVARSLYPDTRTATVSQLPMLAGMLLFSFQSLWLLSQPMMMRTAM